MKSYTDLEQSKVLAEILPIESADMHYVLIDTNKDKYDLGIGKYIGILPSYPAWSLSALLDMIYKVERFCVPTLYYSDDEDKYWMSIDLESTGYETNMYYEKIDVAFEMVVKLKEGGLL